MDNISSIRPDRGATTPFWRRIPKFFLFPAHPAVLLRILALAAVATAPFPLMGSAMFLPLPMLLLAAASLLAWVMLFRYAYLVLEQTSLGRLTPSAYPFDAGSADRYKPYKQLVVLMLMGAGVGVVAATMGEVPAMAAYGLVVLTMPASVMLVAVEGRIGSALHPGKLVHVMFSIGWAYLALCFFLLMLSGGQAWLSEWLLAARGGGVTPEAMEIDPEAMDPAAMAAMLMPSAGTVLLLNAVAMYFSVIMFNMMGYVLYQYHEALGLDVEVEFDQQSRRTPARSAVPRDPAAEHIGALVAAGDLAGAVDAAYEDQRLNPDSIAAHDRYHKLLMRLDRGPRTLAHADRFIAVLLEQQQGRRALEIFVDAQTVDAGFAPAEARRALSLAQVAVAARRTDPALLLLQDFGRRYPGSADAPHALLLRAKVLCEHLRLDKEARELLAELLARHPDHAAGEEARQYLQLIDRLQQA